jgi:3-carboxy-cis,cis-muconate cycloisomerase
VIPQASADQIAAACAGSFDAEAIGRAAGGSGAPVVPLLAELRSRLPSEVAADAHRGATTQDVVDSALMLLAKRALPPLLADARAAADACAALAREHRDAPMVARTLLQQAVPTTFGLKAAGWMSEIDAARTELAGVELAAQLGGSAGTLAALGDRALDVAAAFADELGLAAAPLPWQADRLRTARLASALGLLAGALGKPARDVTLLSQNEIAEVREARGGVSSAMAHKHNPIAAVSTLACAARTPGLAATMLAGLPGELERPAGSWHAEWETLTDLLRLTGSAASWAREMLDGLEVDTARMRDNLDAAPDAVRAGGVGAAGELVDRALAARP